MTDDPGAPDPEITPAMIEAGCREFWGFDNQYESAETLVQRIYRAMARVKALDAHSKDEPSRD